jgi:hypothetical protein
MSVVVTGYLQQPEGGQRCHNRAERIHHAFKAECAPICLGRHAGRKKSFATRGSHSAPQPRGHPSQENMALMKSKGQCAASQSCKQVTDEYGFSALKPIREVSSSQFGDARKSISDSSIIPTPPHQRRLKPRRSKNHCRNFVTPVAEETCEPNAEGSAVQPFSRRNDVCFSHYGLDLFLCRVKFSSLLFLSRTVLLQFTVPERTIPEL